MAATHVTAMTSTIIIFCTADNLKINLFINGNQQLVESQKMGSTLRQFILNQNLIFKERLDDKHQFHNQRAQTTTSFEI
jgi:hypothetical protein